MEARLVHPNLVSIGLRRLLLKRELGGVSETGQKISNNSDKGIAKKKMDNVGFHLLPTTRRSYNPQH